MYIYLLSHKNINESKDIIFQRYDYCSSSIIFCLRPYDWKPTFVGMIGNQHSVATVMATVLGTVSATTTAPASGTGTAPAILSIIHVAEDHTVSSADKLYVPWGRFNIVNLVRVQIPIVLSVFTDTYNSL